MHQVVLELELFLCSTAENILNSLIRIYLIVTSTIE